MRKIVEEALEAEVSEAVGRGYYESGATPGAGYRNGYRETWMLRLHPRDAKTGRGRSLALEGPLRTLIERRIAARRLDCPRIFHRAGKPIREFRKSWRTACRLAGVEGRTFHDLRRTGVRNLVRAGVSQSVAMAISGHRTASVFRRYDITSEQDLRDAVTKVAAYVEGLPAGPPITRLADARGRRDRRTGTVRRVSAD